MTAREMTIDLTPQVRRTLSSLTAPEYGQRGVNLRMRRPLHEWTQPLDCARIADHLGIHLPRWPFFEQRNYRTTCVSREGDGLFAHPVPAACQPLSPHDEPDVHSVLLVYTPLQVDPGAVALTDLGSEDVCWLRIEYGPRVLRQHADNDAPELPGRARLAFRDGTPVGVQYECGPQTLLSWRAETDDRVFSFAAALPLEPVAAVHVLADAQHVPLSPL